MSPAEYLELISSVGTATATHVMNCVSLIFAYLAAAYLAGERISRFQVMAVSLVYSVFMIFPALSGLNAVRTTFALISQFHVDHPDIATIYYPDFDSNGPAGRTWMFVLGAVIFLSWLLSLVFMARVRSKKSGWRLAVENA